LAARPLRAEARDDLLQYGVGRILLLQWVVITMTVAVAGFLIVRGSREQLDEQYGARATAIAESVASIPTVLEAFDDPNRDSSPGRRRHGSGWPMP
jgi:hypothetical protein